MEEFFKTVEGVATPAPAAQEKTASQEGLSEFIYIDHNEIGDKEFVFRCKALSINEADKMFEAELGFDPKNNPNIGCVTEAVNNEDWREKHGE